jgi:hypothetical protein
MRPQTGPDNTTPNAYPNSIQQSPLGHNTSTSNSNQNTTSVRPNTLTTNTDVSSVYSNQDQQSTPPSNGDENRALEHPNISAPSINNFQEQNALANVAIPNTAPGAATNGAGATEAAVGTSKDSTGASGAASNNVTALKPINNIQQPVERCYIWREPLEIPQQQSSLIV